MVSILPSIQSPVSPPFNSTMILSASIIKACDNIPFLKECLNNYLEIEPNTDLIRMLYQPGPTQNWRKSSAIIAKAVKGSSLAAVRHPGLGELVPFICYQDPQLHLRARFPSDRSGTSEWGLSE